MFAVIKTGGKQYRVAADDLIKVEKLGGDAGEMVELGEVLMVGGNGSTSVGAPFVEGAMISAEIVDQGRSKKIYSFKKRRRQNSKRIRGHRQLLTTIRISEILTDGAKPSKKAAAKKAAPKTGAKTEKPDAEANKPAKAKAEDKPAKAEKPAAPKKAAKKEEAAPATLFKAPKGEGDDLTQIKGIGPVAKDQLNEQGITTFAQIAKLTDKDIERIDEAMPFSADQISDWRDQAEAMK